MHKTMARDACLYIALSLNVYSASQGAAQSAPPVPDREGARAGRENEAHKGLVSQYLLNPRGEVDGLFLTDGTQVHFPPHMGAELVSAVKIGDRVTAVGIARNANLLIARQIVNDKNKLAVEDTGPPHPPGPVRPPAPLKSMQVQGSIKALLYGPRGDVNGFLVVDQTIVRMPPETAFSLASVLQPGQLMSVIGNGSESPLGRCIEATSIGTEGQPMISIYDTGPARTAKPER